MSNLRLVNDTSVTSGVSTTSITNVFSSDFEIYKVVAENIVTSAEAFFSLRFINSSGSIISSNDYDFADLFLKSNTTFTERNVYTNYDDIFDFNLSIGSVSGGAGNTLAYIYNPTNTNTYTYLTFQASSVFNDSGTKGFIQKGLGILKQKTSITGLHFISNTGTHTANIKVYGLRVDS